MRNKNKFTAPILFFFISLTMLSSLAPQAHAELNVLELFSFGGNIVDTKNCTCDFVTIVKVGDPQGGTFSKPFTIVNSLLPITSIYDYGKVDKGHMVIGSASLISLPCLQLQIVAYPPFIVCKQDSTYGSLYPIITKIGTDQ